MKLYYSPGACSLSPHIALQEAGLKAELVKVDLKAGVTEAGDSYASVNPKGYVPALQLDDGQLLTEGPILVQYIADQAPAKKLAPTPGTLERYRLGEWLTFINSEIHKSFGPLFDKSTPEETKATAKKKIDKRLKFIDQRLGQHDYLMGSAFSVADGYLYVMLRWARQMSLDLSAYPALAAFIKRMQERPAVNAALAAEGIPAV
jgi:glutathione S-transferase